MEVEYSVYREESEANRMRQKDILANSVGRHLSMQSHGGVMVASKLHI